MLVRNRLLESHPPLKPHINLQPVSIPIPKTVVARLQKITGPVFDTPPMQALIGGAFAALVATILDWKTTSIAANYTGVDAVMKAKGLYIVIEAKGGTGGLKGDQMTDRWIKKRLDKAIKENPGSDAIALGRLQSNGPVLAVVISTELRGTSPAMKIQLQTYKGISQWKI